MSARRPPWVWCRIVRACTALSDIEKLVWDEQRGLSSSRGATMGAGPLGLRLGRSRDTIERARRELDRFELLRKVDLGQGRAAAWFPELPEECRPPRHCRRLTDDEVQELGDKLAARINAKCAQSGGSRAATPDSWTGTRVRGHAATVAAAVPPLPRRNSRRHAGLSSITDGTRGVRGVRGTESNTKTVSQGKLREEHEVDEREATS